MLQIKSPITAEIEIKKSRFLSHLYPVFSRAQAQSLLAEIRTQHPNAVHVCSVLLCSSDSSLDDDGEPSGTAAKPMYNVLNHKNIGNILAVVVRYWGGTKLGAGGLSRAYSQAISTAITHAQLVTVVELSELIVECAFADEAQLRHFCDTQQIEIRDAQYNECLTLRLTMEKQVIELMEQEIINLLRGKVSIAKLN
jgi:uncharacterized YigZ family protein